MKIGIDIDDTLTYSWETFIPHYAKIFGVTEEELRKSKPYYNPFREKISLDEYFEKVKPVYDNVSSEVPIREDAKEAIDKIHKLGHEIIFITARGEGYTDSYKLTKEYLDAHNIYYDKLYVNAGNKAKVCLDEGIDLLVDDSIKHCSAAADAGIDILMMDAYYNQDTDRFKRVKNWDEVYEYIKRR